MVVPWLGHGGADQVALDATAHLSAAGYRVVLACTEPAAHERMADAAATADEVWDIASIASPARAPQALVDLAHRSGAGIVHIINSRLAFDTVGLLRQLDPRPAIIGHLVGEEGPGGGFPSYAAMVAPDLDLFICISDDLRGIMVSRGVDGSRIAVVRPAIDLERFRPDEGPQAVGAPLRVLMPARLSDEKDPLLAIAAIDAATRAGTDVVLTLTGDGPLRPAVEEAARRPGTAGRVRVAGVIADMAPEYRKHDVVLLTSRFEALPLAICEGMASGLPVVAPRVGGIPEIVDASCGILVDDRTPAAFAGALARMDDPAARALMGAGGRQRAMDMLSAEAAEAALDEAYEHARSQVA